MIYPPILKSTQPAFVYAKLPTDTEFSYQVYFTLQNITQYNQIGHIQIRVARQSNNISIGNSALYPDKIIYKAPDARKKMNNYYYAEILDSDLSEPWEPGCLYKIQMRFGANPKFNSTAEFASWWDEQMKESSAFSEWSTVMIIKPISQPQISIENAERVDSTDIFTNKKTEPTLTPLFTGSFSLNEAEKELVDKFKFDIYLGEKFIADYELNPAQDLVESSGWLQHNALNNVADQYRFLTILTNNQEYTVFYSIQTVNGYFGQADPYYFVASKTNLDELVGVSLRVDSKEEYCLDNGCISIYLSSNILLSGVYVLTRSCESTNFGVWEDLHYFTFLAQAFSDTLIYRDFTIESGVKYRYAFQRQNSKGLRTGPLYAINNQTHYVNFQHSYLYHDNVQLKLAFNYTISSFKKTVLTSKQDTLGGKYPRLSKNGYAYYAEFPISGLISFQMDKDQTFLKLDKDGFKYNNELAIPREKFQELDEGRRPCAKDQDTSQDTGQTTNYNRLTINKDLTDDNFFVERKFRDKVEQFLNNFDYKLYKSPSEGNMIIALQNVSLTPNTSLGRMIYSFSATAYEVLDNTLTNLDECGIINIGSFNVVPTGEVIRSFGQIKGIYTTGAPIDVYGMIKQQEEVAVSGGYRLLLNRIVAFQIERYPHEEFVLLHENDEEVRPQVLSRTIGSADLLTLRAELSAAKQQGQEEMVKDIEQQIKDLKSLQSTTQNGWEPSVVTLTINNGQKIIVPQDRLYTLTYPVTELLVEYADYPIIINYISELSQIEDVTYGVVSSISMGRIWGQLSGVFTDNDETIKYGYYWDYKPGEPPFKVPNSDISNFNVYKTLNLYAAIEEDTRKQVEKIYKKYLQGEFVLNENGEWMSGTIIYSFSGIISFEIEARPNTTLKIGKNKDGSDAVVIRVGQTGRYKLSPLEEMINYIELVEPANIIVNYKCLTSQRILTIEEEGEDINA